MEFIEKLYSNELFAPILFTIVGILTVLFIVVLILALRDAKKSKQSVVEIVENPEDFTKYNANFETTAEDDFEIKEEEKPKVYEAPKEDIVNNVVPEKDNFENVAIDAPEEIKEDSSEIKVENEEVASIELERAENDLDEIASTLLKEYQKETNDDEKVETPVNTEAPTSPVFVSPDTLPVKEEEEKPVAQEMPSLSDIPLPQPVRVVQQSTIVDSSKKENVGLNQIQNEEYNIKR